MIYLVLTTKIIDAAVYFKKGLLILSICLFKYQINKISLATSNINYNFMISKVIIIIIIIIIFYK